MGEGPTAELAAAAASVAVSLGDDHLRALAAAYRSAGAHSRAAVDRVRRTLPAPRRRDLDDLHAAWAAAPTIDGSALALALETARAGRDLDTRPEVDVVATGPVSYAAPVRLTSEVVSHLIDRAAARVTLVSYAAYQVPDVLAALDAATSRGVAVQLILESPDQLDGGGGSDAYVHHPTYHWPLDRRDPPDARLHAKAVIVDAHEVLLTSANLTQAAYHRNIELGVLCRGGGVAHQIQQHLDALITNGTLSPATHL